MKSPASNIVQYMVISIYHDKIRILICNLRYLPKAFFCLISPFSGFLIKLVFPMLFLTYLYVIVNRKRKLTVLLDLKNKKRGMFPQNIFLE